MNDKARTACIVIMSAFAMILILAAAVRYLRSPVKTGLAESAFYTISLEENEISITNASGKTVKTGLKVKFLPEHDIIELQRGINVDSYEKVLTLMENYSS